MIRFKAEARIIEAALAAGDDAGKPARISLTAYTGGVMNIAGNGPVALELAGLELPQSIPLLADHDATLAGIVGVGSPRREGSTLLVEGTISRASEAGARIIALSADGIAFQASVGIEPDERQTVRAGDTATVNNEQLPGPFTLITSGTLREVSLVAIGADGRTSVTIAAKAPTMNAPHFPTAQLEPAAAAERSRNIRGILEACGTTHAALAHRALDEGWTADEISLRVRDLDYVRDRPAPTLAYGATMTARPSTRDMLTASALLLGGHHELVARRFGPEAARLPRPNGWTGLCQAALELAGLPVPHDRDELIKAAFSTSTLGTALTDGIRHIALEVYTDTSRNWQALARIVSAVDFRPGKALRLASNTKLMILPSDGELKHAVLGGDSFPFKVDTYGRSIGITRQDLINDDIGLLQDIPTVLGAESSRTVSDVLFETLATAPATFFSAGNGNLLTGTESALSVQSLQTAVQALMTMKDADGRVIGLRPRSLVVPAALWGTASGILNSQQLWRDGTSDLQPSGNPAADLNLTLVIEGRLDAYSVTAWYLSADAQAGGMLAAFLNGQQGIFLDQRDQPPEFLGTIYRAYMDFGIALGEHRALIKANGA